MRVKSGHLTMKPGAPRSVLLSDGGSPINLEIRLPERYWYQELSESDSAREMSFSRADGDPTFYLMLNPTLTVLMRGVKPGEPRSFERVMTGPKYYDHPCNPVVAREELADGYVAVCDEPRTVVRFVKAGPDRIACVVSGVPAEDVQDVVAVCKSLTVERR